MSWSLLKISIKLHFNCVSKFSLHIETRVWLICLELWKLSFQDLKAFSRDLESFHLSLWLAFESFWKLFIDLPKSSWKTFKLIQNCDSSSWFLKLSIQSQQHCRSVTLLSSIEKCRGVNVVDGFLSHTSSNETPDRKKHYRHHHLELCSWFSIIPRLILLHLRRYAEAKKSLKNSGCCSPWIASFSASTECKNAVLMTFWVINCERVCGDAWINIFNYFSFASLTLTINLFSKLSSPAPAS